MKIKLYILPLFILFFLTTLAQNQFTVSGYIKDAKSGEDIFSANVYIKELYKGTTTNVYGFYSITTKPGTYTLVVSYLGMKDIEKIINLSKDITLNFELESGEIVTEEVVVTGERKDKNVESVQTSVVELEVKQVKEIPTLLGEADIFRTLQLMPGIASAGEGNSGLYVRGGGPDQNLVLLDGATVYNPGHLLGFFSVFNSDVIKNTTVYKGGIPAEYGGRISSVIDVGMKEGNMREYEVEGGIGVISSRLAVQGPIVKDKASFIASGRLAYLGFFINPVLKKRGEQFKVPYFFDVNAKLNYKISDKDRIFASAYVGRDKFSFGSSDSDFAFEIPWGNATATFRWNHLFNDKLFMNNTFIFNDYQSKVEAGYQDISFNLNSGIRDFGLKGDLHYFPHINHKVKFGYDYLYHIFTPYVYEFKTEDNNFSSDITKKRGHEFGIYAQDEWDVVPWLKVNAGLRFSMFSNVGPDSKVYYNEDGTPIDTIEKKAFQSFANYFGVEPRLNLRFKTSKNGSVKAGFNYNTQYIHLVSQSTTTFPTDLWIPSTAYVKPQRGLQASLGYFHNFKDNTYETSVEVYYKKLWNQIEYGEEAIKSDGSDRDTEDQFVFGTGQSYGAEFFVKKRYGKFNGWIGYTLAWTERDFPTLNQGEKFWAKYDRRHDLSVVLIYDITKRIKLSATFVYSSGQNTTIAVRRYFVNGELRADYGKRNGYRLPAYHRLDVGFTYVLKDNEKRYSDLNISIYNLYSRKNPYFFYDDINSEVKTDANGNVIGSTFEVQTKQVSLFPILPTLSWNFKF